MSILNKIDEHLTENFTKGKDAEYISGWMVGMFNKRIKDIEALSRSGNYGLINGVVNSTMTDLTMIKKRLDQIAKGK